MSIALKMGIISMENETKVVFILLYNSHAVVDCTHASTFSRLVLLKDSQWLALPTKFVVMH